MKKELFCSELAGVPGAGVPVNSRTSVVSWQEARSSAGLWVMLFGVLLSLLMAGCKKEEPLPVANSELEGLWGLTLNERGAIDGKFDEYVRFYQDGTFEYYNCDNPDYAYHRGTYTNTDGSLVMLYKRMRYYTVVDSIARVSMDIHNEEYWAKGELTFIAKSAQQITCKTSSNTCYLFKVSRLPKWDDELSAPEIAINEANILGQWDQVSFFQMVNTASTWRYFYKPSANGVTLAAGGVLGACPFIAEIIREQQQTIGTMTHDELIDIAPADCNWQLHNDTLTFACNKYIAYKTDSKGDKIAERTVTLNQPAMVTTLVYTLTNYYMTLFNIDMQIFHAFYKNKSMAIDPPSQAPALRQRSEARMQQKWGKGLMH